MTNFQVLAVAAPLQSCGCDLALGAWFTLMADVTSHSHRIVIYTFSCHLLRIKVIGEARWEGHKLLWKVSPGLLSLLPYCTIHPVASLFSCQTINIAFLHSCLNAPSTPWHFCTHTQPVLDFPRFPQLPQPPHGTPLILN